MKKQNIVKEKSLDFAISIVQLSKNLQRNHEYIMSKQILRSGTAVGALVREAEQAESRKDFLHKLSIALKEANETEYWIELLHRTGYLESEYYNEQLLKIKELLKLLISIIKSTKLAPYR